MSTAVQNTKPLMPASNEIVSKKPPTIKEDPIKKQTHVSGVPDTDKVVRNSQLQQPAVVPLTIQSPRIETDEDDTDKEVNDSTLDSPRK